MSNSLPDKIWNYKNFNMGTELDISGEFIYDGMQTLNQMKGIEQDALLFSFLYHVSVGLERLQKIILALFENVTMENCEDFEKSLITHSHSELSERISRSTKLQLNTRENEFLQLLAVFYKTARYHRFNIKSQYSEEQCMIANYIKRYLSQEKIQNHFITGKLLVTDGVKELFGKVIGSISKKYYELVREGCSQNNTYTYELRPGSKAEKVFLSQHRNNSLQEQKITEAIVLKELLVYLRNTKQTNSFMRFLDGIPPIELDVAFLNEYFAELCNGIVPQSLVDEVEYHYEENSYSIDRMNLVNLIGNTDAVFEFKEIDDCLQMLNGLIKGDCKCEEFAIQFPQKLELLEDECTHEILDDVAELCSRLLNKEILHQDFKQKVIPYYTEIKKIYSY